MIEFTNEEFEEKLEKIYRNLIKGINKTTEKKAFLLGGQPGAGKSGLTSFLKKSFKDLVVINGDDFRKLHPHYKELEKEYGKESVEYTKKFSGKMTESLIERLSDEGYNLIIEGTLRTTEVPLKTQQKLAKKDYKVELLVIQVRPEVSYLGTFNRYEEMIKKGMNPRATLKKDHQIVVDNIPKNLSFLYEQNIFSNIRILDRENNCLYSMLETPNIDSGHILNEEFKRMLNAKEKKKIIRDYEKVINSMKYRNALKDEIKLIEIEIENIKSGENIDSIEILEKKSIYEINLQKEILREKSAEIMADFYTYMEKNNIEEFAEKSLIGELYNIVGDIYRNIFDVEYSSLEKLYEANGKLDLAMILIRKYYLYLKSKNVKRLKIPMFFSLLNILKLL